MKRASSTRKRSQFLYLRRPRPKNGATAKLCLVDMYYLYCMRVQQPLRRRRGGDGQKTSTANSRPLLFIHLLRQIAGSSSRTMAIQSSGNSSDRVVAKEIEALLNNSFPDKEKAKEDGDPPSRLGQQRGYAYAAVGDLRLSLSLLFVLLSLVAFVTTVANLMCFFVVFSAVAKNGDGSVGHAPSNDHVDNNNSSSLNEWARPSPAAAAATARRRNKCQVLAFRRRRQGQRREHGPRRRRRRQQ